MPAECGRKETTYRNWFTLVLWWFDPWASQRTGYKHVAVSWPVPHRRTKAGLPLPRQPGEVMLMTMGRQRTGEPG